MKRFIIFALASGRMQFALAAVFLTLAGVSSITAAPAAPALNATDPPGAQRGTELVVTLSGDRLETAEEILFYDRGIECVSIDSTTNKVVKATFRIAPDCRVGEHNLRIRTRGGVTPLRIFYVGTLPAVTEKESNGSIEKAQPVALNSTINGRIDSEDADFFVVEMARGQRLSVEVEGARLGRTMFDSYVAVRDPEGRKVAESDDTALLVQDSFGSLIAPEAGKYSIELRDSSYSGSGHVYRLHIGDFPRPQGVFPLGGMVGEKSDFAVLTDVGDVRKQTFTLPGAPSERHPVLVEDGSPAASPNWIRVSPFEGVIETEPNHALTNATVAFVIPVSLNGVLAQKGDTDYFKFSGKKGQSISVKAWARRLGSPVDTVVSLLNAKGGSVASNDDSGGNPDSQISTRLPEDGDYYVRVTDQLGRGGPMYAYRIEITEPTPSVRLSVPDTARYDYETRKSIVVPQGNRFALLMNVTRSGVSSPLDLEFRALPEGITFVSDTVSNGVPSQVVVFEAPADAAISGKLLEPAVRATEKEVFPATTYRHHVDWVRIQNNTVYAQSDVDRIAAAVVEPVPFKISVTEPKVPVVKDGLHELEVVAERSEGFDAAIRVKMVWNPPGITSISEITIPKGTNRATYRINGDAKAQTRSWKTALTAYASVGGGTAFVSSQLFSVAVAEPFVAGSMQLTAIERGGTAKITCKLDQKTPFDGAATIELVGLPAHVTCKAVEITKDSTEAVFELTASDKAQAGLTKGLYCRLVIEQGGEPITHSIARGGMLRVDVPKPNLATAAKSSDSK